MASEATRAAAAQNLAFKDALVSRDLAALHLAAGEPRLAVDLLDPRHRRDYPREELLSSFFVPGRVFQMAEVYRTSGDVEAAKRLYERAREAATAFDETLSEQELTQQERWRDELGFAPDWTLPVGWMRTLPDLMRSVSDQRLRELALQPPSAAQKK